MRHPVAPCATPLSFTPETRGSASRHFSGVQATPLVPGDIRTLRQAGHSPYCAPRDTAGHLLPCTVSANMSRCCSCFQFTSCCCKAERCSPCRLTKCTAHSVIISTDCIVQSMFMLLNYVKNELFRFFYLSSIFCDMLQIEKVGHFAFYKRMKLNHHITPVKLYPTIQIL
ncbi:hypothetical protein FOCC_FOCC012326 [Frankliniella occidentalis]|nr:hypothetical protein FOCC_FOCC012326 [Frankliniella occidentalis]